LIRKKTLFVIGAGAGFDVGMPLGNRLSDIIAAKLNIKFGDFKQISGDKEIVEALQIRARADGIDLNSYRQAGENVSRGIGYTRSIDSYLNAHSGDELVKICAKMAIVHTILEHERQSALFVDEQLVSLEFQGRAAIMGSWFQAFTYLLTEGIRKNENLDAMFDNVVVVNFNYDRCLEQFLWLALQQLYVIDAARAVSLIKKLKIFHPYGVVGELPWQGGLKIRFGKKLQPELLGAASEKIRTFNEQIEDREMLDKLGKEVGSAEQIIFLGSHYHPQNMELLKASPPARGGEVLIYGTALDRSASDVTIIGNQIRTMLADRGGVWNIQVQRGLNCGALFKDFGTALMR
jgi:hypothetical protein